MIRLADTQDAHEIGELFLASRKKHVSFAPLAHSDAEVRDWIRDTVIPGGGVFVYCERDVIVGFVAISEHDGFSWVDQLYVGPACVGRRYGAFLLSHAKGLLKPPIRVYTFQQNEGARRFYRREGFRDIHLSDGSLNEEQCPDVLLEWRPKSA